MTDTTADIGRTQGPDTCPAWCVRIRPHDLHVYHAGHDGTVWVSAAQEDGWHCPRILVAHYGAAGEKSAVVIMSTGEAPDLAALLCVLGHPDLAALIDGAVASVADPSHTARADASRRATAGHVASVADERDASAGTGVAADHRWLTVAEVCADLQVTEAEWHAWREAGDTPLHVAMPDGQLRMRPAAYDRWLDARTDDGAAPFVPLADYLRDRIREAIDAAGSQGLDRWKIYRLTSNGHTSAQLDDALAGLLASGTYEQFTERTGTPGRPPVRYRRKPWSNDEDGRQ